ncbi:gamma-soluble NSF attachment protein-like, partial [Limulus polyphemus]|uniref:Gamma-soluble NSF attachment protein n=1 Tax=Limulus polyphemus TaxID=6850 RepID=A0ABM1BML1_LIMPO
MATERKVSEGEECIRQAEKYLKTSFFKWKPDYDSAANEYSKAATCFKGARALSKCKDALLRAADCYIKNNSFFSAAKCYEQAALMAKDMKDYTEVVTLTNQACQMFREYGTPDTAALSMEKGAKIIESYHPERAIEMFAKASEVVMLEERPKQAAEYVGKAVRLLLKLKRYDEAAEMMKKELQFHLEGDNRPGAGRLVVAIVLVHLTRDDYVAAQKVFKDWNG